MNRLDMKKSMALLLTAVTLNVYAVDASAIQESANETVDSKTNSTITSDNKNYEEAIRLIRIGQNSQALPLLEKALQTSPGNRRLQADYILCLTWTGAYEQAIQFYRNRETDLKQIPYLPRNIAKAYYELRDYLNAREYYRLGWANDRNDEESFKGLIYSCLRMEEPAAASEAYTQGKNSGTVSAKTLEAARSAILEHYGASFGALESAVRAGTDSSARLESLENDRAVMKLRWDETDEAIANIEGILAKNPGNARARADYILALRKKERMQEVIEQLNIYRNSTQSIPFWVSESAGDAFLSIKKPEEAEQYYLSALEKDPDNINCLMGLFYAYTDMRQWDKAEKKLDEVEALQKKGLPPEAENELIAARGWLLLYKDKAREAEEYFEYYLADTAAESGLRSGLAYSHAWSNQPRRSREQFEIIRNLDPQDPRNLAAVAENLNDLNFKQEARDLAASLYSINPPKPYIEDLRETLRAEDMWKIQPEFRYVDEFGDGREFWASLLLEKPIIPTFNLFAQLQHQETSSRNTGNETWNRAGLGFRWIITPELILNQSLSADYTNRADFGSDTRLQWLPTDPLQVTAEYSSFSLGVPLRARIAGVTAQQASADVTWLGKDTREYGISGGTQWFSDSNDYIYGTARYSQRMYNDPDFKIYGGMELAAGSYSKQDVDYYSPEFEWSGLLTSKIRNVLMIRYEKKWLSDILLRAGVRGQQNYDPLPTAGITYEQSYTHSKRLRVTGNVSYDLKVYDGNYTNALGTYLTIDWRF